MASPSLQPTSARPADSPAKGGPPSPSGSKLGLLAELAKARLTLLVVITTFVGFLLASRPPLDWWLLLHSVIGTALLASGASALNQWLERRLDALMERTQDRPLPSGRMQPRTALILGLTGSLAGLVQLLVAVNGMTALLGVLTLAAYVVIYTPLKTITPFNTIVGAIPGAMPPLMGWVAARGEINAAGWTLFAVQFFWQLPHFLAIAWLYRDDYARAGFRMLPIVDPDGRQTGFHAVSHTLGLLTVSLAPVALGMAGVAYLLAAVLLGAGFLILAIRFARRLDRLAARALFLASIIYLPALLAVMVWDKAR